MVRGDYGPGHGDGTDYTPCGAERLRTGRCDRHSASCYISRCVTLRFSDDCLYHSSDIFSSDRDVLTKLDVEIKKER